MSRYKANILWDLKKKNFKRSSALVCPQHSTPF